MSMIRRNILKVISSSVVHFVCMALISFNLNADNGLQEIKLLNDSNMNSIFYGTSLVNDKMQIFQSIKPFQNPTWGSNFTVSDPDVSVTAYNVKKDIADNLIVGWIGENTALGIYSLYVRYYTSSTTTWSSIITVSSPTHNLVGNFALEINTVSAEIIWMIYDENFNVEKQSAIFTL